jgi:ribosomal protein S18 acetylase RimI-like enzyme
MYKSSIAANETLLHHQTFDPFYKPVTDENVAMEKEEIAFIAETDEGEVIGIVSGVFAPSPKDRSMPIAFLQNIWVDASHRKRGIAQKLHDCFVSAVREKGAKIIDIHVDIHNKEGTAFWDMLPYEVYQERRRMLL